jgi:hypothetical protein
LTIALYGLLGPLIGVLAFLLVHEGDYQRMQSWGSIGRLLTVVIGFCIGLVPGILTGILMGAIRQVKLWMRFIAAPVIGAAVTYVTGAIVLDLGTNDIGDIALIRSGAVAALICALLVGAMESWRSARTARA